MSVDTYSEVLRIAEEFEDSIKKALDSNENQDKGHSDTDEEVDCPANVEQDILTYHYQDRMQRKGRQQIQHHCVPSLRCKKR